jgi:hypothetical protein
VVADAPADAGESAHATRSLLEPSERLAMQCMDVGRTPSKLGMRSWSGLDMYDSKSSLDVGHRSSSSTLPMGSLCEPSGFR